MDDLKYVPDGAHRHREIEKVQKEILQQHKYLEGQINALRTNMKAYCGTPTCNVLNDVGGRANYNYDFIAPYRKPNVYYNSSLPAALLPSSPLYQYDNRGPYNNRQYNTNYYKRPSQYVFK